MINRGPMIANRGAFISSPRAAWFGTNFRGQFFFRDRFFFDRRHHRHQFFFGFSPFFAGFSPAWYYTYPPYYGGYSYPMGSGAYAVAYDSANAYNARDSDQAITIDRLSDEVEHLREAREASEAWQPRREPEKNFEAHQSTVLVFRDRHIQEVKNYAIVGPTLWIFNEQRAMKVPLSSLDIGATTKLNDERGIEFRLPK